MKKNKYFLDQKKRLSKISISTSAFRNQGKPGLIHFTQRYIFENVDLNIFVKALKQEKFASYLDRETEKLLIATKKYNCRWGTARKGLNIFFRDVLYNSFFFEELGLKFHFGKQLEIPLDSKTMKQIRFKYDKLKLHDFGFNKPKVTAIINLNPEISNSYQQLASKISEIGYFGYTRVDLDMEFWIY